MSVNCGTNSTVGLGNLLQASAAAQQIRQVTPPEESAAAANSPTQKGSRNELETAWQEAGTNVEITQWECGSQASQKVTRLVSHLRQSEATTPPLAERTKIQLRTEVRLPADLDTIARTDPEPYFDQWNDLYDESLRLIAPFKKEFLQALFTSRFSSLFPLEEVPNFRLEDCNSFLWSTNSSTHRREIAHTARLILNLVGDEKAAEKACRDIFNRTFQWEKSDNKLAEICYTLLNSEWKDFAKKSTPDFCHLVRF